MQTSQEPLTGRRVLVYLLCFFGVVFGVNFLMAKLAIDTLSGSEVDSAYRASLAYNTEISAARAQAERRWRVAAHVERDGDRHARVRVEARDEKGAPVTGVAFAARLARPTDKRADRAVVLVERESGIYGGETTDIAGGQWDLIIEADRHDARVFLSRNRIVLP